MLSPKQESALTQLAEQVSYNPTTGEFKWRTAGRGRNVHSPAGSYDHNGYLKLSTNVDGKRVDVKANRLAVFIMSLDNHCPPLKADTRIKFADGDRSNMKWSNLQIFGSVD